MSRNTPRPPGYVSKAETAERLGISVKTLDRRMKMEGILGRVLRKGRQLWFPLQEVEAFFELCQRRGRI